MTHANLTADDTTPTSIADIFIWDKRFETGIPELDSQHRALVQLINSLGHILASESDVDGFEKALLDVFDELSAYIEYHFKFEERLMDTDLCDEQHALAHKRAHAEFVEYIANARVEAEQRPAEVSGRALIFLAKWLMTHIIGTDMHMARKVIAIRAGIPENIAAQQAASHAASGTETLLQAMDYLYDGLASRAHDLLVAKRSRDREIAERKLAEDQLSQQQEFSESIINSLPGIFYMLR